MKKAIILTFIAGMTIPAFSQLKVDDAGRVGIGTSDPNDDHICDVRGNLLISNWPNNPFSSFSFRLGLAAWPHNNVYCSQGGIVFGDASTAYWDQLFAAGYTSLSDRSVKSNITNLDHALDKVMSLKTYRYSMIHSYTSAENPEEIVQKQLWKYGFMADEVEQQLNEVSIVTEINGLKMMEYDLIIPLLVASVQEQQQTIAALQNELAELKGSSGTQGFQDNGTTGLNKSTDMKGSVLYQNAPNPFDETTTIKYKLKSAREGELVAGSISVFDAKGVKIRTYENLSGEGSIEIKGRELKPGMYFYTLFSGNDVIDTKTMIIIE